MIICTANVNAAQGKAIDDQTESKLVEMKDNAAKSIEDYQKIYTAAFINPCIKTAVSTYFLHLLYCHSKKTGNSCLIPL